MNLLEIDKVTKQYSGHLALNEVSLSVSEGSIYGLLGPNGAGKTTLIRIINCITMPDSGKIRLNGKELTLSDTYNIGYLPEERGLYKKMKVGEQAIYLARLKGMSRLDATNALKYWFEKFDISKWWNKKVEELSKGMAQKIQFIITILHQPRLLILDEPFSGFDPVNAQLVKDEILELNKNGTTILLSTHNMTSVEELCDEISLVNKSKIVLQGKVDDIRTSFNTNKFFVKTTDEFEINNVEIFSQTEKNNLYETIFLNDKESSNNQLLNKIISQTSVISFEELLPSFNDIFIETVKNRK